MARRARAIHVVEKGTNSELRTCRKGDDGVWETAFWIVGKDTAAALLDGGKIYVHRGQNVKSYVGGEITKITPQPGKSRRKCVIFFRESSDCVDVDPGTAGWGNERRIEWEP